MTKLMLAGSASIHSSCVYVFVFVCINIDEQKKIE